MMFSVIIPAYNSHEYIRECLESVYKQDYDENNYEVIVVDDASPNKRQNEIVAEFQKKHKNLKLIIHKENKRQGGARNTGIRNAKGDWLLMLDSDDMWLHDKVFCNYEDIIRNNKDVDLIKCEKFVYNLQEKVSDKLSQLIYTDGSRELLRQRMGCSSCLVCVRRCMVIENSILFSENVMFEDTGWCTKVNWYAKKVILFYDGYYGYRQLTFSSTHKVSLKQLKDNLSSAEDVEQFALKVGFKGGHLKIFRQRYLPCILFAVRNCMQLSKSENKQLWIYYNSLLISNGKLYETGILNKTLLLLLNKAPYVVYNIIIPLLKLKQQIRL